MLAVIEAPDSRLLTVEQDGRIVACCQLEHRGDHAYFGMFAVSPAAAGRRARQGRHRARPSERRARSWGVAEMHMTVISVREDLIAWYERRGYRRTGRMTPFPYGDERFGIPQRDDLQFELLVKELALSRRGRASSGREAAGAPDLRVVGGRAVQSEGADQPQLVLGVHHPADDPQASRLRASSTISRVSRRMLRQSVAAPDGLRPVHDVEAAAAAR